MKRQNALVVMVAAIGVCIVAYTFVSRTFDAPGRAGESAGNGDSVPASWHDDSMQAGVGHAVVSPGATTNGNRSTLQLTDQQVISDFLHELLSDPESSGDLSARALHDRLVAEDRDDAWASQVEDGIHAMTELSRENTDNAPDVIEMKCRATLCELHVVSSTSALETSAEWPGLVNELRDTQDSAFGSTIISGKALPDGRMLYVTFLAR